jgi:hypothetical protein
MCPFWIGGYLEQDTKFNIFILSSDKGIEAEAEAKLRQVAKSAGLYIASNYVVVASISNLLQFKSYLLKYNSVKYGASTAIP